MKNIFLLVTILFLSFLSFSQSKGVTVKSAQDVTGIKETGEGTIYLPAGLDAIEVQNKAKYYTMYFTITYSPSDGETRIVMVENSERSRGVIRRFLVANELRTVFISGETLDLDSFFAAYIK